MMRLKDKVTLITGGAAGIGKATALKFAAEGAKVVSCDVNEEAGQQTLAGLGHDASFYAVDVSNYAAAAQWLSDIGAKYGRIDVPVNNAGIANAYCFLASDEASFITGSVLRVDSGIVAGS